MPFKKRDGEYYFEAVEALDREFFPKELDAQYLALYPVYAAMYKEYIKTDQDKMECLKNTLMAQDNNEIPLTLGKWQTRILFVERHIRAMKTILDGQGRDSA